MGQVHCTATLTNVVDYAEARKGTLTEDKVRKIVLTNMLADSGARGLGLPKSVIAQLGLIPLNKMPINTANGKVNSQRFGGLMITIQNRTITTDCFELPDTTPPLLGAVKMQDMGIELDLQNEKLILLPETGDDTYHCFY